MALQVCEYPRCKKLTLMDLCEEHRHEDFDEDDEAPLPFAKFLEPGCGPGKGERITVARIPPVIQKKETTMKGQICTHKSCNESAAEDSVKCPAHRDQQRQKNANYFHGGTIMPKVDPATGKRPYTFRTRTPKDESATQAPTTQLPAKRPPAPIRLAEPTMVNAPAPVNGHGPRGVDLDGNAVLVLDRFIQQYDGDVATLRRAREILARQDGVVMP